MEKLISKLAALGVPGLVLLFAVSTSGYVGAAAIVTALSTLGPGGIIGGIATLALIGLIAHGLTEYGVDALSSALVKELLKKGESKQSILEKIEKYPLSKSLKSRLREEVHNYC
ncbi:MAG: hypothetical protein E7447_00215 [Ruminococcaceae bacterium]|nr:hypothetical protein [Oscillospiraceae bacterium]